MAIAARSPRAGTAVQRPAWGRVTGFVLDAATGQALPGATVRLPVDHQFAAGGRAVARTGMDGRFTAQCPLGRSHTGFRWARLLTAPLISFLISPRSILPLSRSIDLGRLPVEVERGGYKPFRGVVDCAAVITSRFSVTLEPVLLASISAATDSFAADHYRWEEVTDFDVQPPAARPGQHVTVTLAVRHVAVPGVRYAAGVESPHRLLGRDVLRLRQTKVSKDGREIWYRGEFRLDGSARYDHEALSPIVVRDGDEVALAPVPHRLLQMISRPQSPDGRPKAADVAGRDGGASVDGSSRNAGTTARPVPTGRDGDLTGHATLEAATEAAGVFRVADAGRYDDALARCLAALNTYPNDAMLHALAGKLLLRLHRPGEALPHLMVALDRRPLPLADAYPDYAAAMIALDRAPEAARRLQADRQRLEPASADGKAGASKPAKPARPRHGQDSAPRSKKAPPQLWLALGRAALAAGRLNLAETAMARASTGTYVPDDMRNALALRRSAAALEAAPNSVAAHLQRARALNDAGRIQDSLAEYRAVVAMDGSAPWQHLDLGEALLRVHHPHAALPELQAALKMAPDNVESHRALADDFRRLNRPADAIQEYAHVLKAEPQDFPALHWTAVLLMQQGKLPAAEDMLAKAVSVAHSKPENTDSTYFGPLDFLVGGPENKETTGFQYSRGAYDWQVLDALDALRSRPDDPMSLFLLGDGLLNGQCPRAAVAPLQKAMAADPGLLEARVDLGVADFRIGDVEDARANLTAAAAAAPADPGAARGLAELLAQTDGLGAAQHALETYRRAATGALGAEAEALAEAPEEDRPWTDRLD